MATIKAVVSTKVAVFAPGTVEGTFDFTLLDSNGTVVQSQSVSIPAVQLDSVTPGSYVVSVSKNGVSASAVIVVPEADVSFNVPDTVVLTLS